MNFFLSFNKKKQTPTRKLPLLPRIGIYIDWSGYEVTYKHVPLLEAIVNIIEAQAHPTLLKKILKKQLSEIKFPLSQVSDQVFNANFRVISRQRGKKES